MKKKTPTEEELLTDLDAQSGHADELATLLPRELTPLERLTGSIERYDRPTEPVWDECFESDESASDDLMQDREQPAKGQE
jgi:antitoxin VapB